jgi:hypothetical protein
MSRFCRSTTKPSISCHAVQRLHLLWASLGRLAGGDARLQGVQRNSSLRTPQRRRAEWFAIISSRCSDWLEKAWTGAKRRGIDALTPADVRVETHRLAHA